MKITSLLLILLVGWTHALDLQLFKDSEGRLVVPFQTDLDSVSTTRMIPICLYSPSYYPATANGHLPIMSKGMTEVSHPDSIHLEKTIHDNELSPLLLDNQTAGYGTKHAMELQLPDITIPNFEMLMLLQQDRSKMMYDSSLLLDDVLEGVRRKPGENHLISLQSPFTIKIMTGDAKASQLAHKILTKDKQFISSIKIAGVQALSKPVPFKLLVSRQRITSSQEIMDKIAKTISTKGPCWFEDNQMVCIWKKAYRNLQLIINDEIYTVEQELLVEICYYDWQNHRGICKLKLSVCPHGGTYLGWPFLHKYPALINTLNNITFQQPIEVPKRRHVIAQLFNSHFQVNKRHEIVLFGFILLMIFFKVLHCIYKCLPNSFYKFYDHVTFDMGPGTDSSNSIQSEGSDTDKDNIPEIQA